MHKCSCLCGSVRFDINTHLKNAINCHCKFCRKSHGSPFVTVLVVLPEYFTLLSGEENLQRYPEDETKTGRIVCNICGSKLFTETAKGAPLSVYAAALEDESEVEVMAHTNVESKSPFVVISDNLPQFGGSITKEDYMKMVF